MNEKTIDFYKQKCCGTCFHCMTSRATGTRYCDLTKKTVVKYQPVCTRYQNALDEVRRKDAEMQKLAEKEELKTNLILTLMFDAIQGCMCFLSYYEKRMDFFDQAKEWPQKKRYAMMKMAENVNQMRLYYNRYFKPDVLRVTKGTAPDKVEGNRRYRDVHYDSYEMCQIMMAYIDKCFGKQDNVDALMEFLKQLPSDDIIFEQKDYDEFKVRR